MRYFVEMNISVSVKFGVLLDREIRLDLFLISQTLLLLVGHCFLQLRRLNYLPILQSCNIGATARNFIIFTTEIWGRGCIFSGALSFCFPPFFALFFQLSGCWVGLTFDPRLRNHTSLSRDLMTCTSLSLDWRSLVCIFIFVGTLLHDAAGTWLTLNAEGLFKSGRVKVFRIFGLLIGVRGRWGCWRCRSWGLHDFVPTHHDVHRGNFFQLILLEDLLLDGRANRCWGIFKSRRPRLTGEGISAFTSILRLRCHETRSHIEKCCMD